MVYFRQPAISSLAGVRRDIEQMRAHPRPRFGFGEVFEQVKLHREWPAGESGRSSALSLST